MDTVTIPWQYWRQHEEELFKKVQKCLKENPCFITCYATQSSNVLFTRG